MLEQKKEKILQIRQKKIYLCAEMIEIHLLKRNFQ